MNKNDYELRMFLTILQKLNLFDYKYYTHRPLMNDFVNRFEV